MSAAHAGGMSGELGLGLYAKFIVERTDGESAPGRKHHEHFHFPLDLVCDRHAIPAIRAYAKSVRSENALLAEQLEARATQMERALYGYDGPCITCEGKGTCVDGTVCPCQDRRS